ncbi:ankyrin repeat-containing domain protein [Gautieria morchelliformis]|nr:ankyrin repeat-containing domain protein [Gautieria morchelliformis]
MNFRPVSSLVQPCVGVKELAGFKFLALSCILHQLNSLPKTPYETYDRILADIHGDDRQDAPRLLQWLAISTRTISMDEAIEVLATDTDGHLSDPRQLLRSPRDMLTICFRLVIITVPGALGGWQLRLAQFSVREYLISEYLRNGDATSDSDGNSETLHKLVVDLLQPKDAMYENWLSLHNPDGQGHEAIIRLLLDHGADVTAQGGTFGNALQAVSSEGLHEIVQLLLEEGADGGQFGSAPEAALSEGHHDIAPEERRVVRSLLEKGVDVNFAPGREYGSALEARRIVVTTRQFDCCWGRGKMLTREDPIRVRWRRPLWEVSSPSFGEKGADVNAHGGNALQTALSGGHYTIVRLLQMRSAAGGIINYYIDRLRMEQADTLTVCCRRRHGISKRPRYHCSFATGEGSQSGGDYGSALQAATSNGHEDINRVLLEKGAALNSRGKYGSALQLAALCGHEAIIWVLLEKQAYMNAGGKDHGSALQLAASRRGGAIRGSFGYCW